MVTASVQTTSTWPAHEELEEAAPVMALARDKGISWLAWEGRAEGSLEKRL